MNPITLEYLKFTVKEGFSLAAPAFASLRQTVAKFGGVKEQYYGMTHDDTNSLLWIIEWPEKINPAGFQGDTGDFRQKVNALDIHSKPTSWFVPFRFAEEVRPALTAPVCEFAFIVLKETSKPGPISESLHKTFTDCYLTDGFTGGNWGIASNSNDSVCLYALGWESRAHHTEYAKSALFAVEIDKLLPHFAPGSMGIFSNLTQERS
ncbi:hypothetical protein GYMLUDRAFT_100862 [Collybiopsis luxurians FD-317 M1]|uniref:Unplaced genomic scaffold GYMLUscaffold_101, whole genome shotgun sequence n=1 Tax=Collybiopsis luxurians FD-317 M1 TaxID=944289 RepID=A0A0D0BR26_9AGAR|nr:hypothetical protein GYMLUDRAFT_100862 [Collybiopsis luxurians FD-317 M1]